MQPTDMQPTDHVVRLESLLRVLRRVEPTTATRALLSEVVSLLASERATAADVVACEDAATALGLLRDRMV